MRFRLLHRHVVVLALLAASLAYAQSYEWCDVKQIVTVQPDGRIVVLDERTLWTDGQFIEAFICFGHEDHHSVNMLPLTGAVGAGPESYAYTQPCGAGTEIVIRGAEPVSERRLRFAYVFDGTLDVYSDVVQWFWNLLQLDHPPIRGYRLVVQAPGPTQQLFYAYVHRYANPDPGRVWVAENGSKMTAQFDNIPPGDGIELRLLMDPALFGEVATEEGLEQLLEEESALH